MIAADRALVVIVKTIIHIVVKHITSRIGLTKDHRCLCRQLRIKKENTIICNIVFYLMYFAESCVPNSLLKFWLSFL